MDLKNAQSEIYRLLAEGKQTMCDTIKDNKDNIENVRDVLGVIGDASTALKIIQSLNTLPNQLYMRKYRRFAEGVDEYNLSERQKILQKVSELKVKTQIPFILNVINTCEEEEKMDFLVKLTAAWMEERLDDVDYRRLALMMEQTPYADLLYLEKLFEKQQIELHSMIDESLIRNGWLIADGIALQQVDSDAAVKCHLTANAQKFGEVVFGTKPEKETRPVSSIVFELQE